MKQDNAYVEPIIRNLMVPVISDRGQPPPVVFRQAKDKVSYAFSR